MMKVVAHDVADVIAVGNGRVPAVRAVGMSGFVVAAGVPWLALRLIPHPHRQRVVVHAVIVNVVHVAVVQVVAMPFVLDGRMATVSAMNMAVRVVPAVLVHLRVRSSPSRAVPIGAGTDPGVVC